MLKRMILSNKIEQLNAKLKSTVNNLNKEIALNNEISKEVQILKISKS